MKLRTLLVLIIIVILVVSCAPKQLPVKDNTQDIEYAKADTSGLNAVYLFTDNGAIPIAYTVDGTLSLNGDVYYYNLKNVVQHNENVKQKTFTYFDVNGMNIGTANYDNFVKNNKPAYTTLALTGNWRLYPSIRHVTYSEQATVPAEYINFIKKTFSEQFSKTNIVITDMWETDIDGDGNFEALVKAKSDGYVIIALISSTLQNTVLKSCFKENCYDIIPFFADLDGNSKPSIMLLSMDTLKTLSVYKESSTTPAYTVYLPIE